MPNPKFVMTIQLGHVISGLITAVPLICAMAVGYSRFVILEEKVARIDSETKLEITRINANLETRIQVLERSDAIQNNRFENMVDTLREQRKSNGDMSNKLDNIREALAGVQARVGATSVR